MGIGKLIGIGIVLLIWIIVEVMGQYAVVVLPRLGPYIEWAIGINILYLLIPMFFTVIGLGVFKWDQKRNDD